MDRLGILWFILDQASSDKLREAAPPLYENAFYHHVTLGYGIRHEEAAPFINRPWTVIALTVAHNQEAQAARVIAKGLPDTYGVPHITLSTAAGIKPFASVAMLKGAHDVAVLKTPVALTGTLEFVYIDQVTE